MRAWGMLAFLVGCADPKTRSPAGEGPIEGDDTAAPAPDTGGDSTAPVDTADTADSGDSGDTAEPGCVTATFTALDGTVTDMTEDFTEGGYVDLEEPGTLAFCPGDWLVRAIVEADLTVVGLGVAREDTVLSGEDQGVIFYLDEPYSLTIENVTLRRGTSSFLGPGNGGGGVYVEEGALSLRGVIFEDNTGEDGGALQGRSCTLDAIEVDFRDNDGSDEAGAVHLSGCTADLYDAFFEDNRSAKGAGALSVSLSTVEIWGSTFVHNEAVQEGGAIRVSAGVASIEESVFLGNESGDAGGALLVTNAEAYLSDVVFEGNTSQDGGGIYLHTDGYLEATDCDFANNTPHDLELSNGATKTLGEGASFACDGSSCEED